MNRILKNLSEIHKTVRYDNNVAGWVSYGPGGRCGPRLQLEFQLVLLFSGRCQVTVGEQRYRLEPGQWILLEPGHRELFEFSEVEESQHGWLSLDPGAAPAFLKACGPGSIDDEMRQLFQGTLDRDYQHEAVDRVLLQSLIIAAMGEAWRSFQRGSGGHRGLTPPHRARQFIHTHYQSELDLGVIARQAGVTPQYLVAIFRQTFGVTPMRYLWQVRTEQGVQLLKSTGLRIAEIAEQAGFQNPYHFSRAVKERYGQSPRSLRDAHWHRKSFEGHGCQRGATGKGSLGSD